MTHEYFCRAYRLATYSAMCVIDAETQAEAMQKLKDMEQAGELEFDGFCEGEPASELIVEPNKGDADDLTESFPENCLYEQRRINAILLNALKSAEGFMAGFEGDERQEGLADTLALLRSALAQGEVQA